RRDERQADPRMAAAGAAHEQQRAAGPHPADGVLDHGHGQPQMRIEIAVRALAVEVGQGRVVRAGAGDHHVVDLLRQALEEPVEGGHDSSGGAGGGSAGWPQRVWGGRRRPVRGPPAGQYVMLELHVCAATLYRWLAAVWRMTPPRCGGRWPTRPAARSWTCCGS